jgi:hypothetical protein
MKAPTRITHNLAIFALLAILAVAAPPTRGGSVVYNLATGLDAANNLIASGGQADAHWSVQPQGGGVAPAQTVYPNNPDWYGLWLQNGPNSDWIARDATTNFQGPPLYAFTRTLDLSGFNLSTVSINGLWAIDDNGILSLNGYVLSSLLSGGAIGGDASNYTMLHPFSVAAGSPYLLRGLNTLTITMTASNQFEDGVRLEGVVTASVPEPVSMVLLALGVGIVVVANRIGERP